MDTFCKFMDKEGKCHELDLQCHAILLREFKKPIYADETGEFLTYQFIRERQGSCGFTHAYLQQARASKIHVKIEVATQLARNDLERGTKLAEIIWSCCQFMPSIELFDKLKV